MDIQQLIGQPLQHGVAHWHDHIGIVRVMRMDKRTSLDNYSLVALRQDSEDPRVYRPDLLNVYLLPADRGGDLIPIPGVERLAKEANESIEATLGTSRTIVEQIDPRRGPRYIFTDESHTFVREQQVRTDKKPDYTCRNDDPQYRMMHEFRISAHAKFEEWERTGGLEGDRLLSQEESEELIRIAIGALDVMGARYDTIAKNLKPDLK